MLEAIEDFINPLLSAEGKGKIEIGVGISTGNTVVTPIGLRNANEVTAYGPPVNQACKMCSKTTGILLTKGAKDSYPTAKGGRMGFRQNGDGFLMQYLSDIEVRERPRIQVRRRRPR
jgi:class 3 adenylate cyclase